MGNKNNKVKIIEEKERREFFLEDWTRITFNGKAFCNPGGEYPQNKKLTLFDSEGRKVMDVRSVNGGSQVIIMSSSSKFKPLSISVKLYENDKVWFDGTLDDNFCRKGGKTYYGGTNIIKFEGTYDEGEPKKGRLYSQEDPEPIVILPDPMIYISRERAEEAKTAPQILRGSCIMNGELSTQPTNDELAEPLYQGFRLVEGTINIESPDYVCDGKILDGRMTYRDEPISRRFRDGVLEEGKFWEGKLENGQRTEDGVVMIVRHGEVIEQTVPNTTTAPSAPVGEPDPVDDPVVV